MPSRRSRRAQQEAGGGDQLAKLAAMKEIMGDPLKDLMGLMTLQRAIDQSDQMRKDEERASRQEALAAAKAASDEQAAYRTYSLNYDVAKANFDLAQAKGKLEEAATTAEIKERQEMVAQRQREVDVKVKEFEDKVGRLPDPRIARQVELLNALQKGDAMRGDQTESYETKHAKIKVGQMMYEMGLDEETPVHKTWQTALGDDQERGIKKGKKYWWEPDAWDEHTKEFGPPTPPTTETEVRERLNRGTSNTNPGRRYDIPDSLDILRSENTSM